MGEGIEREMFMKLHTIQKELHWYVISAFLEDQSLFMHKSMYHRAIQSARYGCSDPSITSICCYTVILY